MMTEEWVMLWYQCLSENYDYSMYSQAKDKGDEYTCKVYEKKFKQIADIYEDFGTLTCLRDFSVDTELWSKWFSAKKHLFMPNVEVGMVSSPADARHLSLKLPLDGPIEETVAEAARLARRAMEKSAVAGTQTPKYRLHTDENGKLVHDISVIRKAVVTSINKWLYVAPGQTPPPVASMIQGFAWQHLDDMEWRLGDAEYEALQQTHRLPVYRIEAFTAIVNKYRRIFRALSRNTIRGRFPDKSPYKSLVWDRFKGEHTYS